MRVAYKVEIKDFLSRAESRDVVIRDNRLWRLSWKWRSKTLEVEQEVEIKDFGGRAGSGDQRLWRLSRMWRSKTLEVEQEVEIKDFGG